LILELDPDLHGSVPWTTEGFLVGKYQGRGGISKSEVFGMIESLDHFYSVKTRWTNGLSETAEIVKSLYNWTTKPSHSSHLSRRQTPGKLSVENQTGDWREFILTGFPGIGPTLARKIIETEPSAICWKEGFDLESVPKLGKIRAKQLREALRPR
jgi:ERCC4-type nuclease